MRLAGLEFLRKETQVPNAWLVHGWRIFYMWMVAGRPCKPDADFERLWRFLLPGTRFPACGTSESSDAAASDNVGLPPDRPDNAEADSERDKALDAT
jgi:hypothetical protein